MIEQVSLILSLSGMMVLGTRSACPEKTYL